MNHFSDSCWQWWASTIGKKVPPHIRASSILARSVGLNDGGQVSTRPAWDLESIPYIRVLSCMWGIWHDIMLTCFFWLAPPHTETSTNPVCDLQIVELPTWKWKWLYPWPYHALFLMAISYGFPALQDGFPPRTSWLMGIHFKSNHKPHKFPLVATDLGNV